MTVRTFTRLHLPTGHTTTGTFLISHSNMGVSPGTKSEDPYPLDRLETLECVNRWNHSEDYKYWI